MSSLPDVVFQRPHWARPKTVPVQTGLSFYPDSDIKCYIGLKSNVWHERKRRSGFPGGEWDILTILVRVTAVHSSVSVTVVEQSGNGPGQLKGVSFPGSCRWRSILAAMKLKHLKVTDGSGFRIRNGLTNVVGKTINVSISGNKHFRGT